MTIIIEIDVSDTVQSKKIVAAEFEKGEKQPSKTTWILFQRSNTLIPEKGDTTKNHLSDSQQRLFLRKYKK